MIRHCMLPVQGKWEVGNNMDKTWEVGAQWEMYIVREDV